jgi:hypothetical protein
MGYIKILNKVYFNTTKTEAGVKRIWVDKTINNLIERANDNKLSELLQEGSFC